MSPLDQVIKNALDLGLSTGLTVEEVEKLLTDGIQGKQNRYKWRTKIQAVSSEVTTSGGCPYTGNFIEDLDL